MTVGPAGAPGSRSPGRPRWQWPGTGRSPGHCPCAHGGVRGSATPGHPGLSARAARAARATRAATPQSTLAKAAWAVRGRGWSWPLPCAQARCPAGGEVRDAHDLASAAASWVPRALAFLRRRATAPLGWPRPCAPCARLITQPRHIYKAPPAHCRHQASVNGS